MSRDEREALRLRAARTSDINAVLVLWERAGVERGATDTPEGLELLLASDRSVLILAVRGDEIVGSLIAAWDGWRASFYRLAVDPRARRRRIASMLVDAGEQRVRALGATRLSAIVATGDHAAAALWRSLGYEPKPDQERWIKLASGRAPADAASGEGREARAGKPTRRGTVDYEQHGRSYTGHRRADPRIAVRIHAALGGARTVLNVGAGAGSYEPRDRYVLAVEPSATMRAQRPTGAAPCIDARAEALPFDTDSFDAAMACVTIHHWQPREAGLAELRRVARGPVVIFTFDLRDLPAWQLELMGEAVAVEQPRFGTPEEVAAALGGSTCIERIPTPADCTDGFFEAFWNRPERLLDEDVRSAQSVWPLLPSGVEQGIVERIAASLACGDWDQRHGHLRGQDTFDGGLRLIVSEPN